MELRETSLRGCFELCCNAFEDARGAFIKMFHQPRFMALGLPVDWQEEYFSISAQRVLRGMHFQVPPYEHAKLVTCVAGEVLDVVVDLRAGSPTYGACLSTALSPRRGKSLYIPAGFAHGFLSLAEESVMHYKVTSVHSAEHDAGILWSSLNFQWPGSHFLISERDQCHPELKDYVTPFKFAEGSYEL
jgi:dTDP-4-dehydrorhamnose 3,5-epimerase